MVIDPDPDEIYTKRKKRIVNVMMSSTPSSSPSVKYPNDGWGNSLERMPSFTRAEMNQHITNSGKKVASIQHHSIPTNLKKAKDIEATSGQRHFYFRVKCYHSFKAMQDTAIMSLHILSPRAVLWHLCSCEVQARLGCSSSSSHKSLVFLL